MPTVLNEAVRIAGGQSALARAIGVKPPTIQQWLKGERPISHGKCAAIEHATAGKVAVEALSPGGWARIADPSWPHPSGRPVREVIEEPTHRVDVSHA